MSNLVGAKLHEKYAGLSFSLSGHDEFADTPQVIWQYGAGDVVNVEAEEKDRILCDFMNGYGVADIYAGHPRPASEFRDAAALKALELFPDPVEAVQHLNKCLGRLRAMWAAQSGEDF
jgi:hypothetical protein